MLFETPDGPFSSLQEKLICFTLYPEWTILNANILEELIQHSSVIFHNSSVGKQWKIFLFSVNILRHCHPPLLGILCQMSQKNDFFFRLISTKHQQILPISLSVLQPVLQQNLLKIKWRKSLLFILLQSVLMAWLNAAEPWKD